MVLMTLTAGGIPKKYFDPLRREVLHTYGHENILTLSRLQEAGGYWCSNRRAFMSCAATALGACSNPVL